MPNPHPLALMYRWGIKHTNLTITPTSHSSKPSVGRWRIRKNLGYPYSLSKKCSCCICIFVSVNMTLSYMCTKVWLFQKSATMNATGHAVLEFWAQPWKHKTSLPKTYWTCSLSIQAAIRCSSRKNHVNVKSLLKNWNGTTLFIKCVCCILSVIVFQTDSVLLCSVYLLLWWPWPLSVDGVWNEWSSWSSCSASCSNGTMQRTRECNGPSYGGAECRGEWLETVDCFLGECPGKRARC